MAVFFTLLIFGATQSLLAHIADEICIDSVTGFDVSWWIGECGPGPIYSMMFHHDGLRTIPAENARTAHIIGQPLLILLLHPVVEPFF